MTEQPPAFPIGTAFLELTQHLADICGKQTDKFITEGGKQLPQTVECLGTMLSIIYRLAACHYGCRGGDHQVEWLGGKIVNQAISAYDLIRAGQYDESLMVVRGTGEIVNLLWLFNKDNASLAQWRSADKRTRNKLFSPVEVRRRLKELPIGPPIDDVRYAALCSIGTHPTPMLAPGHYNERGKPVLGGIVQEMGIFVGINELAYAVAMTVPIGVLLDCKPEIMSELKASSVALLDVLGNVTILNYEEGLQKLWQKAESHDSETA